MGVLYLDLFDAIRIASLLNGLGPQAVLRRTPTDLLMAGLDRPSAVVHTPYESHDLYDGIPLKAAAQTQRLVRDQVFSPLGRAIPVALGILLANRNGWAWSGGVQPSREEAEELRQALIRVEQGDESLKLIAGWFHNKLALRSQPASVPLRQDERPLLFFSFPVSRLSRDQRKAQRPYIDEARKTARTAPVAIDLRAEVYPEQGHDASGSSKNIFDRDGDTVLSHASAMVSIEHHPSSGIGVNLAWAASARLPVLYLHPKEHGPGDLSGGVPGAIPCPYESTSDVALGVIDFLKRNRGVIADQPRRQLNLDLLEVPLWSAFRHRWEGFADAERTEAVAISGLSQRRVLDLLTSPRWLRSASESERAALAGALAVERSRWLPGRRRMVRPTTTRRQIPTVERRRARAACDRAGYVEAKSRRFEAWLNNQRPHFASFRYPVSDEDWDRCVRLFEASERDE